MADELDELLTRFGAGDHSWELGACLASVLAGAGRTAQVPGILVECRPLQLEKLGAAKLAEYKDSQIGFVGWRLPRALGGSGILQAGEAAYEVRLGDRFVTSFGGLGAAVGVVDMGWALLRSSGTSVVSLSTSFDTYMNEELSPEGEFRDMDAALKKLAAAVGATVEKEDQR